MVEAKKIELTDAEVCKVASIINNALNLATAERRSGQKEVYAAKALIRNGYICPPFLIGEKVYRCIRTVCVEEKCMKYTLIEEGVVCMMTQKADRSWVYRYTYSDQEGRGCTAGFTGDQVGVTVFKLKSQAEEALSVLNLKL